MERMNFFTWIRDGVRQAVLLGVSDAVEDLGPPSEGDNMPQRLLEVLRKDRPLVVSEPDAEPARRRKLGRTLTQIQASVAKAS
jgi:hypothetical protein